MEPWILTCFITRLSLRLTHFTHCHTAQYFHSTPRKWDMVSPQKRQLLQCLLIQAGLNLNSSSYQSDEWGSQVGPWAFLGSFVQLELASLTCQERGSLPQINIVWWHLAVVALLVGQGCWASDKEIKTPSSKSWSGPQKCCRRAQTETERAQKLSGSKFIKQAGSDSVELSPKAEPWEMGGGGFSLFHT
jgi:hypothetical protein